MNPGKLRGEDRLLTRKGCMSLHTKPYNHDNERWRLYTTILITATPYKVK